MDDFENFDVAEFLDSYTERERTEDVLDEDYDD